MATQHLHAAKLSATNCRVHGGLTVEGTQTNNGPIAINGSVSISGANNVNHSIRQVNRYYLDEYFLQRPGINANMDQVSTVEVQRALNRNFEVIGTNATTALCTFVGTRGGIELKTAGADQDQTILLPHLDTGATAWTGCTWGTENSVEWECSISTNAIDNQKVWAGLKLTNDQLIVTDANQAYFKFQTDATNSEAFTDFTKLHFIHSVGNTDYISQLPITVAAATTYHLKIIIDASRKASIFVDGVQYDVTTTAGSTGGTVVAAGTTPTAALTNDIDFIPYIGIEAGAAAAEGLDVHYMCMNRLIFE